MTILTATVLVVEQPLAVIVDGLKLTDELAGSPDALNVIVPVYTVWARLKLYSAVCPALTVFCWYVIDEAAKAGSAVVTVAVAALVEVLK